MYIKKCFILFLLAFLWGSGGLKAMNELPADLQRTIAGKLSTKDLASVSRLSKGWRLVCGQVLKNETNYWKKKAEVPTIDIKTIN